MKKAAGLFILVLGMPLFGSVGVSSWAKKPKEHPKAKTEAPADTIRIESNLGEMDAAQVERLFSQHQADFRRCYDEAAASQHYLGGHMQLKATILPSGQAKAVSVVESNLGSLAVERCVAGIIEKLRYPAPKGGEGEVSYPFECAGRTPVGNWPSERIAGVLGQKRGALKGCKGKAGTAAWNAVRATLYVGPGGKATAVGFSAALPLDDKLTRCVEKQLLAAQYDDPLGQMVKVSYDFKDL